MRYDVLGVYLIDFKHGVGGELAGKHYAVILTPISQSDNTLLVAPLTSKKAGKKYRGGFTIDCKKYQHAPTCDKAFVKLNKIREIDKCRIYGKKIYDLDRDDIERLKDSFEKVFSFLKKGTEQKILKEAGLK